MASFETDIGFSSAGISAQFSDVSANPNPLGETVGECVSWSNGARQINIDPTYWSTLSQDGRIELMYHELGHCALNLQHINTYLQYGCPTSIMNQFAFGQTQCFSSAMAYYFQELASHR
jgi:hypothetical protein